MAKSRHYQVLSAFPVRDKDGKFQTIAPGKEDLIEELLTPVQIKDHLNANDLKDNGPSEPEAKPPTKEK